MDGKTIFTAVLPEGYALASGVKLPQIWVAVGSMLRGPSTSTITAPEGSVISGAVGMVLPSGTAMTVTLTDATFVTASLENANITSMFKNIPAGITATASNVTATTALVTFTGTPTVASTAVIMFYIDYSLGGTQYLTNPPAISSMSGGMGSWNIVDAIDLTVTTEATDGCAYADGVLTFTKAGDYTISMKEDVASTSDRIVVSASGVTLNLDGITIGAPQGAPSSDGPAAITVVDGTVLNVIADSFLYGGAAGSEANGGAGIKGNVVIKGAAALTVTGGNSNKRAGMGIVGNVTVSGGVTLIAQCGSGDGGVAIFNGSSGGGTITVGQDYSVWCGNDLTNMGPLTGNSTTLKYVKILPPSFVDFTVSANQNTAYAESKLGAGKATWASNDDGNTLTLKGVDFSTSAPIAMKLPDKTTVVSTGTNAITSTYNGDEESNGINVDGFVTFDGTGTLTATGGSSQGTSSYGVRAYSIEVSDGTALKGIAGTVTSDSEESVGVSASSTISITNGILEGVGGTASGESGSSVGVSAYSGAITVNGGTLKGTGGTASGADGVSIGVSLYGGTLTPVGKCSAWVTGNTYAIKGASKVGERIPPASIKGHADYNQTENLTVASFATIESNRSTVKLGTDGTGDIAKTVSINGTLPTAAEYAAASPAAASPTDYVVDDTTTPKTLHIKTAKGAAFWSASGDTYINYNVYLDSDIDVSAFQWLPVGGGGNMFSGRLDGQGHSMSGLNIDSTENYAGLLKSAGGARIQNLCIASGSVKSTFAGGGDLCVGGIAGYAVNSTIQNCCNHATIFGENSGNQSYDTVNVGGIVGVAASKNNGKTTIRNCFNTGRTTATGATGNANAGGITGKADSSSGITNCYNTGSITADGSTSTKHTGSISGFEGEISGCYSLSGCIAAGTGGQNGTELTDTQMKAAVGTSGALIDSLNTWVNNEASTDYYTWKADSIAPTNGGYPLFGTAWETPFVAVTGITGVPTTATAGTSLALSGTVAPSNATNQNIVWSVKDAGTTYATISSGTLYTGAPGTVVVTATITNGLTTSSNYTQDFTIAVGFVYAPMITTQPKLTYTVGETFNIDSIYIEMKIPNGKQTFNADEIRSGIADGSITTTMALDHVMTAADHGKKVTFTLTTYSASVTTNALTVNAAPPVFVAVTGITSVPTAATAETDLTLSGTVAPSNATNQTIVWSVKSAGTTGATISDGKLKTTAAGTVTVTATITNGLTASSNYTQDFSITVSAVPATITSVTLSPASASVQKGNTQQFTASVTGTNTPAQAVTWAVSGGISGTSITDGLLTVAAGETAASLTVTATSTIDTSKSGTATVTVTTQPITKYTLTVTNGTGGGSYEAGASITVTANTAPSGQRFKEWTATGITLGDKTQNPVTITMPAGAVTFTAVYEAIPAGSHTITASAETGGSISPSGAVTVNEGESKTFSITSNSNYSIADVKVDGASQGKITSYTFNNITANHTIFATFSYNGGGGGGGSNEPSTPPVSKPTEPVSGNSSNTATVDQNGSANTTLTSGNISDAIKSAQDEANKKGVNPGEVTAIINVTTGGKDANTVSVNLPKTVQEQVINNKIANLALVIDRPDVAITMNLATIKEINQQAKADVQLTARSMDSTKLIGEAKAAIAGRPAFDLTATYANGTKSVTNFGGGSVSIEIPYTLGKDEIAGYVYVVYVDANGKVTYLENSSYDAKRGTVVFSTNHFSVYGVGYKASYSFTDIEGHWAKDDILFVANRGLMNGTGNTTFSPNGSMTRGMFVTALGRLAGADVSGYKQSSFIDVPTDAYYMGYVEWANKNGVVLGIGGGKFAPDTYVTREQMAAIMSRYAQAMGYKVPETRAAVTFADNGSISGFAATAVKQMQIAGVLMGKNGNKFDPQGTATRAEVAAVLHRYVELVINPNTAQGLDTNDSGSTMMYESGKLVKSASRTVGGSTYSFNANGEAVLPVSNKKTGIYTVQKDDSFWLIARKCGCTIAELEALNGKSRYSIIYTGETLRVPEQ